MESKKLLEDIESTAEYPVFFSSNEAKLIKAIIRDLTKMEERLEKVEIQKNKIMENQEEKKI